MFPDLVSALQSSSQAVFADMKLSFLQISNLKKVLKGILDYNQEVRARTCTQSIKVLQQQTSGH